MGGKMMERRTDVLSVLAGMLLVALPAGASGSPALGGIAGWEGDSFAQGYGFAALEAIWSLGESWSLPVRLQGSYLYYDFEESSGTTKVRSPGGDGLVGLRRSGPRGSATVFAGGDVRRERRDPGSGHAISTDTVSGGVFQAEGNLVLATRWQGILLANFATSTRYVWSQASIRVQLANLDWQGAVSPFLGIEGGRQGNDESDAWKVGGFTEWSLVRSGISLSVHGGYKEAWSPGTDHRRGPYVGVGFYQRFSNP
jgi:hypothetical protein